MPTCGSELPESFGKVANLYLDASMMWGDAIEDRQDVWPHRESCSRRRPRNRYAVNLRTLERLELDEPAAQAILHANVCPDLRPLI